MLAWKKLIQIYVNGQKPDIIHILVKYNIYILLKFLYSLLHFVDIKREIALELAEVEGSAESSLNRRHFRLQERNRVIVVRNCNTEACNEQYL